MNRTLLVLLGLGSALLLSSCGGGGGGGGGGSATITGTVVYVETGGAPNPQASVQVGGASVLTDSTDGSFTLSVPAGTTQVTVNTGSTSGVWTFKIPATTASATEDVGNLWVGPQRVTLAGQVLDSSNSNPVAGASVSFGGATGVTNAAGNFAISPVAYPNTNFAAFWGIIGNINSTNYFANTFSASPNTSVNGTVTVATVLLTPLSSTTPPNTPYNLWGRVTPTTEGAGCTVTLSQNGKAVHQTTADTTGTYYFWVTPGTYTVHAVNGSHADATDPTVTVTATNVKVEQDVVLN